MIVNKVNTTFCYSFVLWSGFFSAYWLFCPLYFCLSAIVSGGDDSGGGDSGGDDSGGDDSGGYYSSVMIVEAIIVA